MRYVEGAVRLSAISDRIKIARVIGILALTYVHVPPYHPAYRTLSSFDAFDWTWFGIVEGLSRTAVPLLSVLAGLLFAQGLAQHSFTWLVGRKVRTLLMPLFLWCLLAVILNYAVDDLPSATPIEWVNRLTSLTAPPIITPLYFLRDLFLAILLLPLWQPLLRRSPTISLLLLVGLLLGGILKWLFITPAVPIFFAFGFALSVDLIRQRALPSAAITGIAFAIAVGATVAWTALSHAQLVKFAGDHLIDEALYLLMRVVAAVLFWKIATFLSERRLGRIVQGFEPMAFFYFCSHALVLGAYWAVLEKLHPLQFGEPAYIAFFLLSPLLVAAIVVPAGLLAARIWPAGMAVLCGGRVPRFANKSGAHPAP